MHKISSNSKNTMILDRKIDDGVCPWWTMSLSPLLRWVTIFLGMKLRCWLHRDLIRLNVNAHTSKLYYQIALWTNFPTPLMDSNSDSGCSRNSNNKNCLFPPKYARKKSKTTLMINEDKSTLMINDNLLRLACICIWLY